MMNNFLDFILKDIETKTAILSSLPTKTKTNQKKYNAQIDEMHKKYSDYKSNLRNYLLAKSRSFEVKETKQTDIEALNEKVVALEHVKFLLNPSNTYLEKMGFDILLYQISNYSTFNFTSLNEIINELLDKFALAGIVLTKEDFDYTCYVHEYMEAFLEVRNNKESSHEKVSAIFEQIYWVNPDIIEHIELNFRKLIRKNDRKFTSYISDLQKTEMASNHVENYMDCLEKLQDAYAKLNEANENTIFDIIEGCEKGEIDINSFLQDSKIRNSAYEMLVPETIDKTDVGAMDKVCVILERLKANVKEYSKYMEFEPIFKAFKEEYQKTIPTEEPKKQESTGLKDVLGKIEEKEQELDKMNRKIFGTKNPLFDFKSEMDLKQLKSKSVMKAKELYELYAKYDEEYFKDQVKQILNPTLTVADVLHLYYSFDYFKKQIIQKVYKLTTYDDITRYSDSFDLFAMNPTNIIISGVPIFEETDVPRVIVNKYRLNGIKLEETDLSIDNIQNLLNRIDLVLQIHEVETSTLSVEKIWFIIQVHKLLEKEQQI